MVASDRETLRGLTQFSTATVGRACKSLNTRPIEQQRNLKGGLWDKLFQTARKLLILKWRDVGVVDRARLESVCRGNSTEGSNPSLSATSNTALILALQNENTMSPGATCRMFS